MHDDARREVLDDARKKSPSGKLREQLALTECEVYGQGARIERDDARRNELFHAALEQYQDFLVRYPSSEFRSAAETGMVTTAVNFSKSVDIALETLTGEAADELNQKKIGVLEEAVKLTAQLVDAIEETPSEERTAQQLADAAGLMLNRGRMLADIGGAQANGTYFFEQAIVSLENMVFFFGEGTPQSLRAYQALGAAYHAAATGLADQIMLVQRVASGPDALARAARSDASGLAERRDAALDKAAEAYTNAKTELDGVKTGGRSEGPDLASIKLGLDASLAVVKGQPPVLADANRGGRFPATRSRSRSIERLACQPWSTSTTPIEESFRRAARTSATRLR